MQDLASAPIWLTVYDVDRDPLRLQSSESQGTLSSIRSSFLNLHERIWKEITDSEQRRLHQSVEELK
jgi:uncharacterized protein YaaW (UPF0174 family)